MDTFCTPVLYIDPDAKVKDNQNPSNGSEYLQKVIAERANCMETVSIDLNHTAMPNRQTVFFDESPAMAKSSPSIVPTIEWQNCQVADFSSVRLQVSNLLKLKDKHTILNIPSIENSDKQVWREFFENKSPNLTIIFAMNQPILEHCLDVLLEWLDEVQPGSGIEIQTGIWIFAVLACLKLPLVPAACSLLRDLARKCSVIRSQLPTDEDGAATTAVPLNLFICLVARYFRQTDLADGKSSI